jgi:hypothetical protein
MDFVVKSPRFLRLLGNTRTEPYMIWSTRYGWIEDKEFGEFGDS